MFLRIFFLIFLAVFMAGCQQENAQQRLPEQQTQNKNTSSGMFEHIVTATAAGVAAGSAGAVSHNLTNHAIDSIKKRRRAKIYSHRRNAMKIRR